MWRQRLADYEERSRDRLQAATTAKENTADMNEQIMRGKAASAERLSQAQIEAEQGKTVSQLGIDLGIPGIQTTTALAGKGISRVGMRLAGQIDTKQMLGLKKMPDTKTNQAIGEEGDVVKPEEEEGEIKPEDVFPTEEEAAKLFPPEPKPEPEPTETEEGIELTKLDEPKDIDDLGTTETSFGGEEAQTIAKTAGTEAAEAAGEAAAEGAAATAGETVGGALSTLGGTLGDLAGPIGLGLGIWGAYETVKDIMKGGHAYDAAIAAAKSKIEDANAQIKGLQTQVSADQFESKVGGARPSFGSLAATPSLDTSKQVKPALTF